jgi:hypothetical protein
VDKYHTLLASVFERALVDRVITVNPCSHPELPKRVQKKARTLTPEEYDAILAALPEQHRLMVDTAGGAISRVGHSAVASFPGLVPPSTAWKIIRANHFS